MAEEQSVTDAQIAKRCGLKTDDPEVKRVRKVAEDLLADALAVTFKPVPQSVRDEALLSVAKAVNDRKRTTNGNAGTTVEGTTPIRSPRDPQASLRSILANYVVPL